MPTAEPMAHEALLMIPPEPTVSLFPVPIVSVPLVFSTKELISTLVLIPELAETLTFCVEELLLERLLA